MDTKLMPIDINFLDTDYIYDGYDIVEDDKTGDELIVK